MSLTDLTAVSADYPVAFAPVVMPSHDFEISFWVADFFDRSGYFPFRRACVRFLFCDLHASTCFLSDCTDQFSFQMSWCCHEEICSHKSGEHLIFYIMAKLSLNSSSWFGGSSLSRRPKQLNTKLLLFWKVCFLSGYEPKIV